jgi:predicted RNA binding protein YcfA (HicA-like mRNA interferase family)
MTSIRKVYEKILTGRADSNIRFDDLRRLLLAAGFDERTKGSHCIFTHAHVEEIINVQPLKDGSAKAYQVKQVRQILTKHQLGPES